jgi:hypothetical protein
MVYFIGKVNGKAYPKKKEKKSDCQEKSLE